MLNFDFYSPTKIYFGKKREEELGSICQNYGYKKVLLHYGKSSIKKNGLYEKIVKSLNDANITFIELGGVEANPKVDLVRIGTKLAKENKVDAIIAVGGGSVIDSAKSIACSTMVEFDPWLFSNHEKAPINCLPIGVVLTISAAGSELSNSCVISNPEIKVKNGFNSDLIRPKFAIMNPELTYSVSPYQTACGIVDILMHTLERYMVETPNVEFTKNISEGLLKSVIDAGNKVMSNPFDYEARATLMIASSFSHNGLTGLGSKMYFTVHKLEHEVSGMFDEVAHGAGLSVLFIAWAKWIYEKDLPNWVRFAKNVMNVSGNDDKTIAYEGILKLEEYFKSLNMPLHLSELNIYEDSFEKMANHLTKSDTTVINGVINLDKQAILEIFSIAK